MGYNGNLYGSYGMGLPNSNSYLNTNTNSNGNSVLYNNY